MVCSNETDVSTGGSITANAESAEIENDPFPKMEFGRPSEADIRKVSIVPHSDSYWARVRNGIWRILCQKQNNVEEPTIEDIQWVKEDVRGLFNQPRMIPRSP